MLLFYLPRIHPRDKTTIGKRLALAGLSVAYGKKMGLFQGPFPSSYEISHNPATLTIIYDFHSNKIQQRSSDGFEVCVGFITVLIIKLLYNNEIIVILVLPPVACQIVPSQCLAWPMAMLVAVASSWVEQAAFIIGQTSRCCMVCLMPQS